MVRKEIILLGLTILMAMLATAFAITFKPEPHSDWLYYWRAAGDFTRYGRGGVALMLLGLLKAGPLQPHVAALVLNLAASIGLVAIVRSSETSRIKWNTYLTATYLLLISPFFGIVQTDLPAAAMVATGLWLALGAPRANWLTSVLAVLMIASGVSSRPQYFLVLPVAAALCMLIAWNSPRSEARTRSFKLALILILGAGAGFATDNAMREVSGNSRSLRTSSAVTLYSGLFAADAGPLCGHWSPAAAAQARRDANEPLIQTIINRLASESPQHIRKTMRCKFPHIVMPRAYAVDWLLSAPNVARQEMSPIRKSILESWRILERYGFLLIVVLVYLTSIEKAVSSAGPLRYLPIVWIGSFWLVHLVFEIQARYFMPTILLSPLLCTLTAKPSRPAMK